MFTSRCSLSSILRCRRGSLSSESAPLISLVYPIHRLRFYPDGPSFTQNKCQLKNKLSGYNTYVFLEEL